MKILAITACTAGIAHTYIAKEKLENAAKELGDSIKVETRADPGGDPGCGRDPDLRGYPGEQGPVQGQTGGGDPDQHGDEVTQGSHQ